MACGHGNLLTLGCCTSWHQLAPAGTSWPQLAPAGPRWVKQPVKTLMIYMDDILITTPNNIPHHRQLVHQVLDKLEEHDLFLKPEKCTFEVPEIEYLGLVIGGGRVRMDR